MLIYLLTNKYESLFFIELDARHILFVNGQLQALPPFFSVIQQGRADSLALQVRRYKDCRQVVP